MIYLTMTACSSNADPLSVYLTIYLETSRRRMSDFPQNWNVFNTGAHKWVHENIIQRAKNKSYAYLKVSCYTEMTNIQSHFFLKIAQQVFSSIITCYYVKNAIICLNSVAHIISENYPAASSLFPTQHAIQIQKLNCRNVLRILPSPRRRMQVWSVLL